MGDARETRPDDVAFVVSSSREAPARRGGTSEARDKRWADYITRSATGDQAAFASLYDESSSIIYAVALRILGNPADADEVTLDVYTQVWRSASGFQQGRGSVNAWLVMLARSRAIDRLRSRKRNKSEESVDEAVHLVSADATPEQHTADRQRQECIQKALATISPEQRQAIELAFYAGYSQSELAEHLNQPLGTVKTRIRLGMMKLKEQLAGLRFAES